MIPNMVHSSVRSGAERRLFNVIRSAERTDNWICFHSLGLARHDYKRVGEVDFVLVATYGVFVLEVKGGRIRRDGGSWINTDRYGEEHWKNEGPFEQAASAMFTLEREASTTFQWNSPRPSVDRIRRRPTRCRVYRLGFRLRSTTGL